MKTKPTTEYAGQHTPDGRTEPCFTSFFPNPWGVREYGHKRIWELVVREPNAGETPDYWSWWDEKEQRFEFTWAAEFLLEMCFTYGTKAEEERGRGKKMRTVVEVVREVPLADVDRISEEISKRRRARTGQ